MQNFKIVASLLLGYFWLVMKMKIKIKELLIIIATLATAEVSAGALAKAVIQEVMQNFKIVALLLLGYFWLVMKMKIKIKELLIIIATLATTEVSAGALAG